MSDIEKESYEDFLNFEKLWDEWRLREEVPQETFVGSGYFCVEEFYNFSKKYFENRLKQQLAKRDALILELEKVRGFYANIKNWKCSGFTRDYVTEFKLEINEDDGESLSEAFTRGGKLARTLLKNQKLLDEIKLKKDEG